MVKATPLAAVFLVTLGVRLATPATLTNVERQRMVAHLEMTGSWLHDEVHELSAAQLQFRPAQDAWSILEVVDHLVVSEAVYWQDLQKALKAPLVSSPRDRKSVV